MFDPWTDRQTGFWRRHRLLLIALIAALAILVPLVMARTQWVHEVVYSRF